MTKPFRSAHLALLLFSAGFLALMRPLSAASSSAQLTSGEKVQLQREARLVVDLLQNYHYTGRSFREIENAEMITRYLSELDPGRDFFQDEDITFFQRRFGRSFKTVYLFRGDLQPAFEIFDQFSQRAESRSKWILNRLDRPFDFTTEESFDTAPDAKLPRGTDAYWELRLKSETLAWVLAGKSERDARESLHKFYSELRDRVRTFDSFALRERLFDAVIRSFDPHSGYFSADSSREFAQLMENAATGIGLELRKEGERYVVAEVQPGGPVDLESTLAEGDFVDEIAADGERPINLTGKRSRDVAALLRGPVGRRLTLGIEKRETSSKEQIAVSIRRVVLTREKAYGTVHSVPSNGTSRRIGQIVLPSFYTSSDEAGTSSAAADVRELLEQMLKVPIDGLVIDLRDNPGGALTEALGLSGLFLDEGVVMRTRGPTGDAEIQSVEPHRALYRGPLVVLTSPRSASASEIFAGAMKFHQRAVVVGHKSTFGKGTVQNYISLSKLPGIDEKAAKDWGSLRLTYQRFYQPDGKSVQNTGIISDIIFPDSAAGEFTFESELPHALPADLLTIKGETARQDAAPLVTAQLVENLASRSKKNFETLPEWALLSEEVQAVAERKKQNTRNLSFTAAETSWQTEQAHWLSLKRRREALSDTERYPCEPITLSLVRETLDLHQGKLRQSVETETNLWINRLNGSFFSVETIYGRIRRVDLKLIDFSLQTDRAEELAAVFSKHANIPCSPEQIQRLLRALSTLERKTQHTLVRATTSLFDAQLGAASAQRGLEAVLTKLTAYDIGYSLERPPLDVEARESLRVAAAWAEAMASTEATP